MKYLTLFIFAVLINSSFAQEDDQTQSRFTISQQEIDSIKQAHTIIRECYQKHRDLIDSLVVPLNEEMQTLEMEKHEVRSALHQEQKGVTDSLVAELRIAEREDPLKARDIRNELMLLRSQIESAEQLITLRNQTQKLSEQARTNMELIMAQDPECAVYFGVVDTAEVDVSPDQIPPQPLVTPSGGVFIDPTEITLSPVHEEAFIYYTLDGSAPDTNSLLYTDPIPVDGDTEVKFVNYMEGFGYSEVASEEYIFSSVSVTELPTNRINSVSTSQIRYYTLSERLLSEKEVLSKLQPVIAVNVDKNEAKRQIVNLNRLRDR